MPIRFVIEASATDGQGQVRQGRAERLLSPEDDRLLRMLLRYWRLQQPASMESKPLPTPTVKQVLDVMLADVLRYLEEELRRADWRERQANWEETQRVEIQNENKWE